jgi:septum formation protein
MGLRFSVVAPNVPDERMWLDPANVRRSVARLAEQKARSVAPEFRDALVVGTDTVVVHGGEILGKPADEADARRMLRLLSGNAHEVLTGVALIDAGRHFECSGVATTRVQFRHIPPEELERYLRHAEYRDKAGAYGIQDAAMVFVERLEGCYYNVVGLPVAFTIGLLESYQRQWGISHERE